jgi:hypothetical protein
LKNINNFLIDMQIKQKAIAAASALAEGILGAQAHLAYWKAH